MPSSRTQDIHLSNVQGTRHMEKDEGIPGRDPVMNKDRKVGQGGFLEPGCEILCLVSALTSLGLDFLTRAS